jgi:2-oxoisovalerate dehydrogenase E2 component (dihydrolipoyl transacylase)
MKASLAIPHFNYGDTVTMDALVALRQQLKPAAAARGVKLTYLPLMLKAASMALHEYPMLNATVAEDETSVTYLASHNLSVAMDSPAGLIVPNVKNCQDLSVMEIAAELARLQQLAAAGKLGMDDLTGGTFALSNIGAIGGTHMGPVIMLPQVAIGAVGKIEVLPRFNDKMEVFPSSVMTVTWAGDHRVIDGATMARFSNKWKGYLENPSAMLVDMR